MLVVEATTDFWREEEQARSDGLSFVLASSKNVVVYTSNAGIYPHSNLLNKRTTVHEVHIVHRS